MNVHEKMSEEFDDALLGLLVNGREVVTKDGELETIAATAADLNVIRQRLKDCGITAEATADNPIGNIIEEMNRRKTALTLRNGTTMPECDVHSDDAATA